MTTNCHIYQSDKIYTTRQAAAYLGCSTKLLEKLRSNGTGPRFGKLGSSKRARVFYRKSELDAWLAKRDGLISTAQYRELA